MIAERDVLIFIHSCKDPKQLRDVNGACVEAMRNLSRNLASTFNPGDKVRFSVSGKRNFEQNGEWKGVVRRVAGKAVVVLAKKLNVASSKEMEWKVGPSSLRLDREGK